MSQMSEMPVIGTTDPNNKMEVPEIKGYAYVKGLTIPKYKESYVVVQDGALIAYKDNSLQGVLVTFPIAPWRFKDGVTIDKKDLCKHAEHVFQIFQGQDAFFMAFPTNDQYVVWMNQMKLVIDVVSPIVFGIPLDLAFYKGGDNNEAPAIITKLMNVIEKNDALTMDGIFRISAANSEVTKLREAFNTGNDSLVQELLDNMTDFNVAAHLIKLFFRELPDPLLRYDCYDRFIECEDDVDKISEIVATLPRENILTLRCLMTFLAKVASHEEENMMGPSNLAIVFGPTILRSLKEGTSDSIRTEPVIIVCQTMITNCDRIFSSLPSPRLSTSASGVNPTAAAAVAASAKRFGKSDMFSCGAAAAAVGISGLRKTTFGTARTAPSAPKKDPVALSSSARAPQPTQKTLIRSTSNTNLQRPSPASNGPVVAGTAGAAPAGGPGGEIAALKAELAKMRNVVDKLQAQCAEQEEKIKEQDELILAQDEKISLLEERVEKVMGSLNEERDGQEPEGGENEEEKEGEESEQDEIVKERMEALEKGIEEMKMLCESQKKIIDANQKEIESLTDKIKNMSSV